MERHALIAARILISIIFLLNGLNIIGQTLAMHEMAAHGVPVSLIPALIMGGACSATDRGYSLGARNLPPYICHRLVAFPHTSYAHGTCILADGGHITVHG